MRRILWIATLVVAAAASLYFAARWQSAEHRAARAQRLSVAPAYQGVMLSDLEIAQLKKLGLPDPIPALKADLATHGKLLPFRGVFGGTMAFYDREAMVFLPGYYVYAEGEDGHYLVHAVLRYAVQPGGTIQWRLLDAHRD
jgi:hypothetical protein